MYKPWNGWWFSEIMFLFFFKFELISFEGTLNKYKLSIYGSLLQCLYELNLRSLNGISLWQILLFLVIQLATYRDKNTIIFVDQNI